MAPGPRSWLSALLAAALLSGFIVVGAAPASAAVTPAPNPDLEQKCGLSVAVVLDASQSIAGALAVDKVRTAASTMLTSLSGTGSSASIVQFGTVARQDAGYNPITASTLASSGPLGQGLSKYFNPQPALTGRTGHQFTGTGDPLSAANYTISSWPGYTNWEDALLKTGAVPGAPGGKADLVVFVTDGDPTAVNTQPGYPFYDPANPTGNVLTDLSGVNQALSLDPAITAANTLKNAGSKILTLGVGRGLTSAASQARLKQVSGPDLVNLDIPGSTVNVATDDVVVTSSFDVLGRAMAEIATSLCKSSLTITKLAQSPSSNQFAAAPGWQFSVTPTVAGGSLTGWTLPAGASGSSASTATDTNGQAAFQWQLSGAAATTSLLVQETLQPGYTFGSATCTIRNGATATTATYTTNPFTIPPVPSTAILTCEVTNAFNFQPGITLKKTASPTQVRTDVSPPIPVIYTYVATNSGNTPLANVALTDNRCTGITAPTGDTNGNGLLDTTETWTFTCTQTLAGVSVPNVINTATIRGTDPAGTVVTATDTATVRTFAPALDITKTADQTVVSPGKSVTYTYVVKNTGNADLTNVTVADDKCSAVTPASVPALAVGASTTFTCTTTLSQTTVNVATATGTPPIGPPVTDTATATVTVTPVGIALTKTANGVAAPDAAKVHPGDQVTYQFEVTLPAGDASVSDVVLSDPGCSPITGPTGDGGTPGTLEPGETWTYTCLYTVGQDAPDLFPNTATVTGKAVGPGDTVTDTDTALVQVLRPAINVLKSANPTLIHSGDSVVYRYGVTNPGNTPLTVGVSDDKCLPLTLTGGDTNGNGLLDPGETWLYSCTTALTADTTNTVTANGTDALGKVVTSTDTAYVEVLNPAITLTKTADRTVVRVGPDNTVTYTLTATNTGDADLSGITFTDNTCSPPVITGGDANGDGVMNPAEVWTATCSAPVTATTTNTADVQGTDALGRDVSAQAQATVTVIDPQIDIVKTASRSEVRAGDTVTYTYLVTNTGDTVLTGVNVADNFCSPVSPTLVLQLAVGASTTFTCSMALPATTTNEAIATGTAPDGLPVADNDNATVVVRTPSIGVKKSADKTVIDPGGSVTYTYVVTNTGDTPLAPVSVTDDACSPVTPASVSGLAPGANSTFTCTTTLTVDTVNTATATGGVPIGGPPVTSQDRASVDVVPSGIEITKSADKTVIHSGDLVNYSYSVRNIGQGALSAVTVTDDYCTPVAYTGGDTNTNGLLDTTETWTYTCSTAIPDDTVNTATVTATTPGGGKVTDTDQWFVDVIFPSIQLVKTASPTIVRPGDLVVYTITVTNTSTSEALTMSAADVVDDRCQPLVLVGGNLVDSVLMPGQSVVFACSANPTATVTNTATVTAIDRLDGKVTDKDTATVDVQDPRLAITKSVDKPLVNSGETVTYTINVSNPATTPSPLTNVRLVDDTCSGLQQVTFGNGDAVLDPGETWQYTCTAVISKDTVNTATATATPKVGPDLTSSASATVRIKQVDVAVRKTTSTPVVSVGGEARFTIEASNFGPDTATGVVITDTLPAGLTFVSASPSAEYNSATGQWTVGELAAGQAKSLTLVVKVEQASPSLTNTATRTATNEVDTNPNNDKDTSTVVQQATLALTKTASPSFVNPGGTTDFTVTVTNQGPSAATNVVVNDKLPAPLVFVSAKPGQGTYDAASGVWTVGGLASGASANLVITARVPEVGSFTNVATATSDQQDPNRTPRAEATVTSDKRTPLTPPTPPPTVPPTVPPAPPATPPARSGTVPTTGAGNVMLMVLLGLMLIGVGVAARRAARRR